MLLDVSWYLLLLPPSPTASTPPSPIWSFLNSQLLNTAMVIIFGLVSIAAFIVALRGFRQQRHQKELAWQVRSDSLVVSNQEVKDRIVISLDGVPVQDLSLVAVQIWNSGDVAIESKDYVHPIKLNFKGRAVQDAYISDIEPTTLITGEEIEKFRQENVILRQKEQTLVKLPELHLNSQRGSRIINSYTVKVLLTGPQGKISLAEGMINDGYPKEVPFLETPSQRMGWDILLHQTYLVLGIFTAIITIVAFFAPFIRLNSFYIIGLSLLGFIAAIIILVALRAFHRPINDKRY